MAAASSMERAASLALLAAAKVGVSDYYSQLIYRNIPGVVAAVADMLCAKIPNGYKVINSASERGPQMLLSGSGPQGMVRFLSPLEVVPSPVIGPPKGSEGGDQVLSPVSERRIECGMLKLFLVYLKGEDLFGVTVSAVIRIIESLPEVEAWKNYAFRYGHGPLMEQPLAFNPSGSARSQPRDSLHIKRPHTRTNICPSKSFQSTVAGEISTYSKQFVHSKSSRYRKMKAEWKSNVYLAHSGIQVLGLYAAKDFEKHTMIIEYIGTIIRNEVANRKEKLYINHLCAPNCIAEVATFQKGHKIISSNRRIQKGEEMCYDYKFDLEDDQHKIPCHCGAVKCRNWMN